MLSKLEQEAFRKFFDRLFQSRNSSAPQQAIQMHANNIRQL